MFKKHFVLTVVCTGLLLIANGCAKPQFKKSQNWTPNPRQAPPPPPVKKMPISAALEAKAASQMADAVRSDQPIIRAHAMEALKTVGGEGSEDVIVQGIDDPAAIVRFAAVMAAGERRIASAKPALLNHVEDPNTSVQVAVRYALHRLGDYRYSHDLESFATHPQAPIRANTAMVLGLLGEPTGMNILNAMMHDREPAVLLAVNEARWRLGDMESFANLVAASQSAFPDYQIVALLAMAGPKDQRVSEHVRSMLTAEHVEVQLAAATAMANLDSDAGYAIAATATASRDPRQQLLAALALGAMGRSDAQQYLAPLLDSGDADVRLAAASAILRLAQQS